MAFTAGKHPYTCDACDALRHGQTSQLMRKLHRSKKSIYPRGVARAGKPGISNKHLSKSELESSIRKNQAQQKVQKRKINKLEDVQEKLLKAFMENLINLFNSNSLSELSKVSQ